MKRNLNVVLKTLKGEPLKEQYVGPDDKPLERTVTLSGIATNALLANYEDERNLSGDDKVKRFKLAQQINDADGEVEVTAEQVSLLKSLIAKGYTPLVVGQAYEILEGE